ncbi:MAG: carbohydrate kinase family protein, partial [Candidatus Caldatribacteriaceae bacterium]
PRLWKDSNEAQKLILRAVEMADFLKLTAGELRFLTGCQDLEEGVKALLSLGVKNCVVTLGEKGAFFVNPLGGGFVPAFSVSAIDPVGCGDAFCAGILRGVVLQKFQKGNLIPVGKLGEMVVFASACGALTAQAWGGVSSFPSLTEVEKLLQESLPFRDSIFTPPR